MISKKHLEIPESEDDNMYMKCINTIILINAVFTRTDLFKKIREAQLDDSEIQNIVNNFAKANFVNH